MKNQKISSKRHKKQNIYQTIEKSENQNYLKSSNRHEKSENPKFQANCAPMRGLLSLGRLKHTARRCERFTILQLSSKLTWVLEKSPPVGLFRSGGHRPTLFFAGNPNLRTKMTQNLQHFVKVGNFENFQIFKIFKFANFFIFHLKNSQVNFDASCSLSQ